jgi:hypothetical protein
MTGPPGGRVAQDKAPVQKGNSRNKALFEVLDGIEGRRSLQKGTQILKETGPSPRYYCRVVRRNSSKQLLVRPATESASHSNGIRSWPADILEAFR